MSANVGAPAPTPMNTASNPISPTSWSSVKSRPMTVLQRNVMPRRVSFAISASTTSFGRRKSGIP